MCFFSPALPHLLLLFHITSVTSSSALTTAFPSALRRCVLCCHSVLPVRLSFCLCLGGVLHLLPRGSLDLPGPTHRCMMMLSRSAFRLPPSPWALLAPVVFQQSTHHKEGSDSMVVPLSCCGFSEDKNQDSSCLSRAKHRPLHMVSATNASGHLVCARSVLTGLLISADLILITTL